MTVWIWVNGKNKVVKILLVSLESTIDFSSYRNDFNNLCRHQANSDDNSMVRKTDSPSLAFTEMMMFINSDDNNQFQVQSVESQISQRKMPFYTRFCSFHSLLIIYWDDRGFNVLWSQSSALHSSLKSCRWWSVQNLQLVATTSHNFMLLYSLPPTITSCFLKKFGRPLNIERTFPCCCSFCSNFVTHLTFLNFGALIGYRIWILHNLLPLLLVQRSEIHFYFFWLICLLNKEWLMFELPGQQLIERETIKKITV